MCIGIRVCVCVCVCGTVQLIMDVTLSKSLLLMITDNQLHNSSSFVISYRV